MVRFFSAFVVVSNGQVADIRGPFLKYCPLVDILYGKKGNFSETSQEKVKLQIKEIVERKISEFGFFTCRRELARTDIAVPFGASEMLMYALCKKFVDAAVVVCDGAGSVIVPIPEIVQGIGARMNGIFYTTKIPEIVERLTKMQSHVVFSDGQIDQIKAAEKACSLGYKKVAVTINGYMENEELYKIAEIEKRYGSTITTLVVCTTGVSKERALEIREHADLVRSCASTEVREIIGLKALLQVSEKIPVFVLTQKGLHFVSAYSNRPKVIQNLNSGKQYLLSRSIKGEKIKMGDFETYLSPARLPMRSRKEPTMLKESNT